MAAIKQETEKQNKAYNCTIQQNFLRWWKCFASSLSSMVATGHKYLLSTWNVAVQLSNWILLFRFNSFSFKWSHVAATGKKQFYSLSQSPPAPDKREKNWILNSVLRSGLGSASENKSLSLATLASQGQCSQKGVLLVLYPEPEPVAICSLVSGS